jgi:hypothetical protein
MSPRSIIILIIALFLVVGAGVLVKSAMGICDAQEWIYVQPIFGETFIQDNPGPYWKGFAKTWAYPKHMEFMYNDNPNEGDAADERIRTTYNDGGTAQHCVFIRVGSAITEPERKQWHEHFGGDLDAIKSAVRAHATNCLKSTAPLMSGSEHQSSRKAEFANTVERQLTAGLYVMREVEKELKDRTDENGDPITVAATEIVLDEQGVPMVAQISPLSDKYNMVIEQFSIEGSDYDPETLQQFAAKKKAFLAAEESKALRESEVQERLMIEEKGKREKAEAEAAANVLMATAVILTSHCRQRSKQRQKQNSCCRLQRLSKKKQKYSSLLQSLRQRRQSQRRKQSRKRFVLLVQSPNLSRL